MSASSMLRTPISAILLLAVLVSSSRSVLSSAPLVLPYRLHNWRQIGSSRRATVGSWIASLKQASITSMRRSRRRNPTPSFLRLSECHSSKQPEDHETDTLNTSLSSFNETSKYGGPSSSAATAATPASLSSPPPPSSSSSSLSSSPPPSSPRYSSPSPPSLKHRAPTPATPQKRYGQEAPAPTNSIQRPPTPTTNTRAPPQHYQRQQQQQQQKPQYHAPQRQKAPSSMQVSDNSPEALLDALSDSGIDWADKCAAAELMEETKKSLLAQLTVSFMGEGGTKSAAEAKALASTEYQEHIAKMVEARRQANTARVKYDSVKVYLNMLRTYEASRRAEMQML